jgi:hemerythrin-like domain-containing protein
MLYSIEMMEKRGPKNNRALYFEVLRSMLFYIDEFPEKQHHPKENSYSVPTCAEKSARAKRDLGAIGARITK